jgi:hypothetical protein
MVLRAYLIEQSPLRPLLRVKPKSTPYLRIRFHSEAYAIHACFCSPLAIVAVK